MSFHFCFLFVELIRNLSNFQSKLKKIQGQGKRRTRWVHQVSKVRKARWNVGHAGHKSTRGIQFSSFEKKISIFSKKLSLIIFG